MTQQSLENYLIAGKSFLQALNTHDASSQFVKALELNPLNKEALICLAITKAIKGQSIDYAKRGAYYQESVSYLEQSGAEDDYVTAVIVDIFKNSSNKGTICCYLWDTTYNSYSTTFLAHIAMNSVLKLGDDHHRIWEAINHRSNHSLNRISSGVEPFPGERELISLWLDKALKVAPPEKLAGQISKNLYVAWGLLRAAELLHINHDIRQELLVRAWELRATLNSEAVVLFKKKIKELKKKFKFSKPSISFWS